MTTLKTYRGERDGDYNAHVYVRVGRAERRLRLYTDLVNKSPSGFEWGYGGSGPAQLALALLADGLADRERALRLFIPFMWSYTALLPRNAPWLITSSEIAERAAALETMLEQQA